MTYEEWEAEVHERVKKEPVWQFLGYRKALFLYDLWSPNSPANALADSLIR